jgi:hypothetical protein
LGHVSRQKPVPQTGGEGPWGVGSKHVHKKMVYRNPMQDVAANDGKEATNLGKKITNNTKTSLQKASCYITRLSGKKRKNDQAQQINKRSCMPNCH